MSAEILRQAAALMRERAEDANLATGEGSWRVDGVGWVDPHGGTYTVKRGIQITVCEALTEEQAEHIASWHPLVALNVADWLDSVAAWADEGVGHTTMRLNVSDAWDDSLSHALAVAHAYLGADR